MLLFLMDAKLQNILIVCIYCCTSENIHKESNFPYNVCLSPLTLWVQTQLMARCTGYNIMW